MIARAIARVFAPRSYCAACRRPFFSDRRFRCPCGETRRVFSRSLTDSVGTDDRIA